MGHYESIFLNTTTQLGRIRALKNLKIGPCVKKKIYIKNFGSCVGANRSFDVPYIFNPISTTLQVPIASLLHGTY